MTDSGLEDPSISPASSCTDYKSDVESSLSLPQSEASAFSKIQKLSLNAESRYPFPPTAMPIMFPNSGLGYFPTFPMSPWIPADTLSKGFPSMSPMTSRSDVGPREVPPEDVFYRVDPRVPFTNYFMNLTKLLKKDEKSSETSHKECDRYDTLSREESDCHSDEEEMTPKEEDENERQASTNQTDDLKSPTPHSARNPDYRNMSALMTNPALLCLSQMHPYPSKVPSAESLPHLSSAQTSMIQLMSGMSAPSAALIHPAFLHMSALGQKRLNQEKPPPVKKYKCDVCGKAFSRSNTLVTHKVCMI